MKEPDAGELVATGLAPCEHSEWLARLGANRPRHVAVLTADILARTGPPPLPPRSGPGADTVGRFLAERVIPLLADDNHRRALLRAARGREAGIPEADVDDAAAEASFWAHVRDWAGTWAQDRPVAQPPANLPRPRRPAVA